MKKDKELEKIDCVLCLKAGHLPLGEGDTRWFAITFPAVSYGRNLEFAQRAGDSSPTLGEGHLGIFNVHRLILADGTPGLTSMRGTAHTFMNHSACETPR